ncbi:MAG: ribulokinase, partial [Clostridia bacterium]|nr:ribulokinase [Clostridia bacterium]
TAVGKVLADSGVSADDVVGIGIDFTSCTVLPVDENGIPLCFKDEFKNEPHAYVKLWKHHGAEAEAAVITAAAAECGENFLAAYGGKVNSEMMLAKMLETYNKAKRVYDEAYCFVEAGDWIVWQLTGKQSKNTCMAGFKSCWTDEDGFPSDAFFEKIGVDLREKLSDNIVSTGTNAGCVTSEGAKRFGLKEGTAVSAPIIDAHVALPAAGINDCGKLMIIIGTSSCHIVMDKKCVDINGIVGRVYGGVSPGLYAYEAGQVAVGDIFDWYVKNNVPASYEAEAKVRDVGVHALLAEKAEKLAVGESGLVALDWWNGCRSPYGDFSLRGMIHGFSLKTRPEEIYRALIEATAFGTKQIVDTYEGNGISIDEVYATGGISQKNAFLMQIYSDVLGKKIIVSDSAPAYGAAVLGADAAGVKGNFVFETRAVYTPNSDNTAAYGKLYEKYLKLSEFFKDFEK